MNASIAERPIFIVGPGRSGTTLLRSLLSAHSRIAITPETHLMKRAALTGGLDRGAPPDFELFWQRYTSSIRFHDLGVDADRCRELVEQQGDRNYRSVFRAVLIAYGERVGKARVGEKTPGHVHFISHLLDWFPDARVLVVQRDPRAVVASQLRTPWVQDRRTPISLRRGVFIGKRIYEVAFYADDWSKIYEEIVPAWRSDSRVCLVSYEALVDDAEGELRKICSFLGERYEPSMLTTRTSTTVPVPAADVDDANWRDWQEEHHAKTFRPVSADSVEKWREDLSGLAVAMIEGRCIRGMTAAGYAPSTSERQQSLGRVVSRTLASLGNAEVRARALPKRVTRSVRGVVKSLLGKR